MVRNINEFANYNDIKVMLFMICDSCKDDLKTFSVFDS